jgi:hypothetical protein
VTVAAEVVCAPPGVEEAADRPHRRPDLRAQAEVEAEGLHPVRPGAAAGERHLRLGREMAAVATDLWGLVAEALLQVPELQLVPAEEGVAHFVPARRSSMQ